jgi:hypothetical protein
MEITLQGRTYTNPADVAKDLASGALKNLSDAEKKKLRELQLSVMDDNWTGNPDGNLLTPDLKGSLAGDALGVDNMSDFLKKISDPSLWKRIGLGAAGAALIYMGFQITISQSKVGKAVTSTVTGIATKGIVK